jgi:hypothetical protein
MDLLRERCQSCFAGNQINLPVVQINRPSIERQTIVAQVQSVIQHVTQQIHDIQAERQSVSVPEPGALGLMLGGLSIVGLLAWRRRMLAQG